MVRGARTCPVAAGAAYHNRSGGSHNVVIVHVESGRFVNLARAPERRRRGTRIVMVRNDMRSKESSLESDVGNANRVAKERQASPRSRRSRATERESRATPPSFITGQSPQAMRLTAH